MRKSIYSLIYIFLVFSSGYCDKVTLKEVNKVADLQSRMGYAHDLRAGAFSPSRYSVEKITALRDESGTDIAYVALLSPRGFVVVSPDDSITPVIAYSFRSGFDFEESPDNVLLAMVKKDMTGRLRAIPLVSEDFRANNRDLWDRYMNGSDYLSRIDMASQWPDGSDTGWIKTTWDQMSPYNKYCPMDGAKRSVVGCVATAMAQLVAFHRYPESISFSVDKDSYTTKTKGISIPSDYKSCDFPSFSQLNSMLSHIDYADEDEDYAAALSFACGIIVEMDYTASASGAWFTKEDFLEDLDYSNAREMLESEAGFYDTLINDMKNRRPALITIYEGSTSGGGHAIIADGYRDTGEYHLNYGWGSSAPDPADECWYSLPDGMPAGYSMVYHGLVNITPPNLNPYNAYEHSVSYPNPFKMSEAGKVTISLPLTFNGMIDNVRIYTVAGDFVRELSGGDLFVNWNGRNESNKKCAPGLYFYCIETTEDEVHKGKITVMP
ncbi:MAG: C10 family peptidase [Elusimicrobia bacterium]|nr:C10 family peptidase [Elusimicrobiota bacterium]